jgi:uncharacterized protein (TIGR00297 family)
VIGRALAGALAAAVIAIAAWRADALSRSGAVAALLVGTVAVAAGWAWGALLILYFVSSSALSKVGAQVKAQRSGGIVEKGGARDAVQVLANGGVFAVAAALMLVHPSGIWLAAGAGALAASAADSWGTEIGMLAKSSPRMITTWQIVPTGTSGGVSVIGLAAMAAGALFISLGAWLLHWNANVALAVLAGGLVGALADSFAGALFQSRRFCRHCERATERLVHDCGTRTERAGGVKWLNNDGVNAACTLVGAVVSTCTLELLH